MSEIDHPDPDGDFAEEPADSEKKTKSRLGKTVKVSLGVLGGLGLLMGYISAAGMQESEREAEGRKAIDDFFSSLNARDPDAVRQTLHFPHVHFAGHEVNIWNDPLDFVIDFDSLTKTEGWHYSTLDFCAVRQSSEDKIHFEIQYSRHRADTSTYATYQSLWIVTRIERRWGIQCRSILVS